ncbi:MAG: hypothetical protein U0350_51190 [Caldilineaceae bacterium]
MNGRYRALAGRIRQELAELEHVVKRTTAIWQAATRSADDYHLDAVALNLHGFYAGLERIFEMVAETVDQAKPDGDHWHQELLRQMAAEISNVRPAVITLDVRNNLDEYRGFRHVVRNVYTFNLDPERIDRLVKNLSPLAAKATTQLSAFADLLEQITNGT